MGRYKNHYAAVQAPTTRVMFRDTHLLISRFWVRVPGGQPRPTPMTGAVVAPGVLPAESGSHLGTHRRSATADLGASPGHAVHLSYGRCATVSGRVFGSCATPFSVGATRPVLFSADLASSSMADRGKRPSKADGVGNDRAAVSGGAGSPRGRQCCGGGTAVRGGRQKVHAWLRRSL
jgi:hypothetical protein